MSECSLSLLESVLSSAKAQGADASDAVLFDSTDVSMSWRMGKSEGIERSESKAVGLRVFVGKRQANVSSTDLRKDTLDELAQRAVDMAKIAPEDPHSMLAPAELHAKHVPDLDLFEDEISTEWLQEQCASCEEAALAVEGITNSDGADASYEKGEIAIATSAGFAGSYRTASTSISVSVIAGEGTLMETDYDYTVARHREDLEATDLIGKRAAERTLQRLNPKKMSTQQVPVVFDPRISKSFVGYLASAISGNAITRGTSFLKDSMNETLFAPNIQIMDDPHRMRGLASKPFDAEGVANKKMALVKDGALQSWILDLRSANQLGLVTTGHASRGLGSPPSPYSTNLYMEAGDISPAALMDDIKEGFYVTDTFGFGVNLVTGDYSQGASGLWIENGQKAYAVSEVTIAGNLREMFQRLIPADDLEFRYGTNCPTLRIDGMTVAGN